MRVRGPLLAVFLSVVLSAVFVFPVGANDTCVAVSNVVNDWSGPFTESWDRDLHLGRRMSVAVLSELVGRYPETRMHGLKHLFVGEPFVMVLSLVAHGACGGRIQKTADKWTDGLHLVFRRVPDGAVLLSVDLGSLREFDAEDLHRSGRVPEVLCGRCGQSGGGAVMVRYEHVFAEAEAIGGENGFSDGRGVLVRVDVSQEKLNPLFCPMGFPERGKGAGVLARTYLYLTRPGSPRERGLVLYSMGMSIRRENRERADEHFLKSVSLDPSLAGPNRFLADYYLEKGDYRSAIECYRRVVARVPKHERRAYEKVIEQWERVLSGEQVDEGETQGIYLE